MRELNAIPLLDKRKNVTRGFASEAEEELASWANVEAGAFFLMEGAKPDVIPPRAFECDGPADELDDVRRGFNLSFVIVSDAWHYPVPVNDYDSTTPTRGCDPTQI